MGLFGKNIFFAGAMIGRSRTEGTDVEIVAGWHDRNEAVEIAFGACVSHANLSAK